MKLFLHVHTRDRNYKPVMLRMRDAWEESKHPRGQPDNPGQFSSGGGSSSKSTATPAEQRSTEPSPSAEGRSTTKKVKLPVKYVTKSKTKATFTEGGSEEFATGYAVEDEDGHRVYVIISDDTDAWKILYAGYDHADAEGKGQESLNKEISEVLPLVVPSPKAKSESGSNADKAAADLSRIRVGEALERYNKTEKNASHKARAFRDIGHAVFDYMGVDPSVGFEVNEPYEFTVAGHKYKTGGWYSPKDNAVTICTQNDPTNKLDELISHEAMHAKFQAVRNAYNKESDRIHEAARDDSDKIDLIMKPNGEIREDYKKEFPVHAAMPKGFAGNNLDKLMEDDGITDYSRSYWEGVHNGTNEIETAINETLAEMARLDREGSLPRMLWYKNSKSYKPLYNNIHKLYPAAVEMLKNDKTRDD